MPGLESLLALLAVTAGAPASEADAVRSWRGPPGLSLTAAPMVGIGFGPQRARRLAVGGRLALGFSRDVEIEASGAWFAQERPDRLILNSLLADEDDDGLAEQAELRWTTGLALWWRPIHGALAIDEDLVIGRFRVGFGAGVAVGATRVECTNQTPLDPNRGFATNDAGDAVCNPTFATADVFYEPDTVRPMGQLGVAFDLDLLGALSLRFEVRDYLFAVRVYRPGSRAVLSDTIAHRVFAQLGLGVVFD